MNDDLAGASPVDRRVRPPTTAAGGSPLERGVGRLPSEGTEDPHADHWTTIAVAGVAVAASSNVTQEQCVEFCAALDRLSNAIMGEAQEDHERMNWLAARHAGVEVEQDDIGVRVTLPRRYGEPVRLEWCTSLRHAIDRAMRVAVPAAPAQ